MTLTLTTPPVEAALCTSTDPGHGLDPITERLAAAAVDWRPARLLTGTEKMLLIDVEGQQRWLGHHNADGVVLAAKYGTVRFHDRFNLLEVGGWMFNVVPLADEPSIQWSPDC